MKRLFNLNSSKKSLSLALLIASFTVASSGSIVAHAGSQDADVPPVGQEWIKVKIPLKMGYYSTAESKHKVISSAQYKVENLSDYPVKVSYGAGFVGKDGSSKPITTGVQELNMVLSDGYKLPLVEGGSPTRYTMELYNLGARSGTPVSGNFNKPSSGTISFSGSTQNTIDTSKLVTYENKLNFELSLLDPNGQVPKDQTSITVKDSTIVSNTSWNPKDNFVSGTDEWGKNLDFSKVKVSGTVDTATPGTYTVTYSYRNVSQKANIKVQDLTAFTVHDSNIKVGDSWQASDNFNGGTDELGQPLDISKVKIGGDKVDTNAPGTYKVTYSYRNIMQTADVVVNGNLTFMNQAWDIIKGPDKMGAGNYLISSENSLGNTKFNTTTGTYYINSIAWDGYQDSDVKPIVDKWYNNNVKGTIYEQYVQPVSVPNPRLSDMKALGGWIDWNNGGSNSSFLSINQPNAYPTKVNTSGGSKRAFLMSGSDVSNGQGSLGNLIPSAIQYLNKLSSNSISKIWLRTPGTSYNHAANLYTGSQNVDTNQVDHTLDIVPALVIHVGEAYLKVKDSTINPNTLWQPADNFVSATDETGNTLDLSKVTISGDKVNTSKPGIYNVTYSYGKVTQTAKVTVKDLTAFTVHDSTINVGGTWKASDNFDGGTDELGQPLDISKVTIGGDKVDSSKVGTYKVNYTYRTVTKTATITVTDKDAPKLGANNTINYMNQTWDIIKGPDKMGSGNYLISMQSSIGTSSYIPATKTGFFEQTTATGNPYDFSLIKPIVDKWYADNIKGKSYEEYVQPAYDKNVSKPEAIALGFIDNIDDGDRNNDFFLKMNHPEAFPTTVSASQGKKQAFILSGSDLSSGNNGTSVQLSDNAIQHGNNLIKNKVPTIILRNVGASYRRVSAIRNQSIGTISMFSALDNASLGIVPSIIVHVP